MMVRTRLAKLQRAVGEMGGGICRLCHGHPVVAVRIMHEHDPAGPGLRETGERYLPDGEDRFTEDLRCRRCGAGAVPVHLIEIVGISPPPQGRLVRGSRCL